MARLLANWLEAYLDFTRETEPPLRYHLWTGVSTIAACMQRKCHLDWGHMQIYPNLYILLVGPPGGRKGTAMKIGKKFLKELHVPMAAEYMTRPALVQSLEEAIKPLEPENVKLPKAGETVACPKGPLLDANRTILGPAHCSLTIFSEEFAVFLGEKNPDMVMTLTDLFDAPEDWTYKTKHSGHNTLTNTWLNIIGATTPQLLQNALTQDAVGGGLTSRIIFIVEGGKRKKVPLPYLSDKQKQIGQQLKHDLEDILQMSGQFRFSEGAVFSYTNWYLQAAPAHPNVPALAGYNERRALHLLKLSMIASAARASDRLVTEADFDYAVGLLTNAEQDMHLAFHGIGRSANAQLLGQVMLYLATRKAVPREAILDHFKLDTDSKTLDLVLQTLIDLGKVAVTIKGSSNLYTWRSEGGTSV